MTDIRTPVGRLVQGNPWVPNTTDRKGAPLVYKTGAKAGQPRTDFYLAIAIEKTNPEYTELKDAIVKQAQMDWPNGEYQLPNFAWKVMDGDGIDENGRSNAEKPGFAGCWVLKFSGTYPPQCVARGGSSVLTDPASIKRGDYIRIYGTVGHNRPAEKKGLYLNYNLVEFQGYGEEIRSGPDAKQVFQQQPTYRPAGMSDTPVASAPIGDAYSQGAVTAGPAANPTPQGLPAQSAMPGQTGLPQGMQATAQPMDNGAPGAAVAPGQVNPNSNFMMPGQ